MDSSSTGQRLKRYLQVSSTLSGLAARLAGEKYLGIEINRDQHAQDLTLLLGNLKGPLMKVAQFLATVPGALPPQYADQLLELQSNAPPMGWPFVRRRMAAELGPNWQEKFQSFNQDSAAAASLGQIHRAILPTGDSVACKLQYANMQSIVEADLNQLKLIFSAYQSWNKAIDPSLIQHEIQERLHEELDYIREAENIKTFQEIFQENPRIHLPEVYPELSTSRLLTMSWEDGQSLLDFTEAAEDTRNDICKLLFEAWYKPFYHHGIIHGDPHPGNYKLRENQLVLLDLGCVRYFNADFVGGVITLYQGLEKNNKDQIMHAYNLWGFKNLTPDVIEIMTIWAHLLFDPLLDDRVRYIQEDLKGQVGWETLTKVHEALHQAGGVQPPKEFVFMDRAAVGIGSVIMRLQGKQNWHRLFNELIETSTFHTTNFS